MIKGGIVSSNSGSAYFGEQEYAGIKFIDSLRSNGNLKRDSFWVNFFDTNDNLESLFDCFAQNDNRSVIYNNFCEYLNDANTPADVQEEMLKLLNEKLDEWGY